MRNQIKIFIFLLFFTTQGIYAQSFFNHYPDGSSASLTATTDNSIAATNDGGSITIGTRTSGGNADAYIVKLSSTGTVQWSRTIGTPNYDDYGMAIVEVVNGQGNSEYYCVGTTFSPSSGSDNDVLAFGLDQNGFLIAVGFYGQGGTWGESGFSITPKSTGGFLIGGVAQNLASVYPYIIDVAPNLALIADARITLANHNQARCLDIAETTDGNIIITGDAHPSSSIFFPNDLDVMTMKLTMGLNPIWTTILRGSGTLSETGFSVINTNDGGYAVAGNTQSVSFPSGHGALLIKFNVGGFKQWDQVYNTLGSQNNANSLLQDPISGEYVISADASSCLQCDLQTWLFSVNSLGAPLWSYRYPSPSHIMFNHTVVPVTNGYLLHGRVEDWAPGTSRHLYVIRTDITGTAPCMVTSPIQYINWAGIDHQPGATIANHSLTPFALLYEGYPTTNLQACTFGVPKTSSITSNQKPTVSLSPNVIQRGDNLKITGVPENIRLSLSVYDLMGRLVISQELESNSDVLSVEIKVGEGVYMVHVLDVDRVILTEKLTIISN